MNGNERPEAGRGLVPHEAYPDAYRLAWESPAREIACKIGPVPAAFIEAPRPGYRTESVGISTYLGRHRAEYCMDQSPILAVTVEREAGPSLEFRGPDGLERTMPLDRALAILAAACD